VNVAIVATFQVHGLCNWAAMDNSVLISTFLLTLLLAVGLLFFIKASVKDRTQVIKLRSDQSEDVLLPQLRQYFTDRAYQVDRVDAAQNSVTLSGYVRPSLPLAIFLAVLAGVGALCLGLVLAVAVPMLSFVWVVMLAVAPLTGWFYWQQAGRSETVSFAVAAGESSGNGSSGSVLTVTAHRDEVAALQRSLNLQPL
jgi:Cofactor assembly of complex C subunit B